MAYETNYIKKIIKLEKFFIQKTAYLKGVRQVGKTWILKEFGRCYYENTAYFNFDENPEFKQFLRSQKILSVYFKILCSPEA